MQYPKVSYYARYHPIVPHSLKILPNSSLYMINAPAPLVFTFMPTKAQTPSIDAHTTIYHVQKIH